MTTRRICLPLGAVLCLSALTAAGPAASQQPAPSTSATATPGDRADELYRKGIAAGGAKDWPRAFQFLWEAYQLKKSYDIEGNLGTAELRLGKYPAAAEHLAHSLTLFPVNGSPDAKAKTEALLEEAKKEVGILRLTITPAAPLVKVGDRQLTAEDRRDQVFVEPGEMRVSAGGVDDYEGASQSVKVAKGQVVDVTLTLKKSVQIVPTASGSASAAPSAIPVDPIRTPLLVSGGVLTGIGIGVGIGTMVAAFGAGADADKLRAQITAANGKKGCMGATTGDCQKLLDTASQQSTLSNVAVWSFVGSAGVGIATVVYALVTKDKSPPPKAMQVMPAVGPTAGGFVVNGRF